VIRGQERITFRVIRALLYTDRPIVCTVLHHAYIGILGLPMGKPQARFPTRSASMPDAIRGNGASKREMDDRAHEPEYVDTCYNLITSHVLLAPLDRFVFKIATLSNRSRNYRCKHFQSFVIANGGLRKRCQKIWLIDAQRGPREKHNREKKILIQIIQSQKTGRTKSTDTLRRWRVEEIIIIVERHAQILDIHSIRR